MTPSTEDLKRLRQHTEEVLRELGKLDRTRFHEPINWADLHCIEAAHIVTDGGYTYLRVTISEAAPECPGLYSAVEDALRLLGWRSVEVVTEW